MRSMIVFELFVFTNFNLNVSLKHCLRNSIKLTLLHQMQKEYIHLFLKFEDKKISKFKK